MVESIGLKGTQSLKQVLEIEQSKLSELVSFTRNVDTSTERNVETLGALIVLGVHSKDVTAQLIDSKVETTEEFEWLSQLRYYVLQDQPLSSKGVKP
jgi:dynein heavy chain